MYWIFVLTSLTFILVNSQLTSNNDQNSLTVMCQPICLSNSMVNSGSESILTNPINQINGQPNINTDNNKESTINKEKLLEKVIIVNVDDSAKDDGGDSKINPVIKRPVEVIEGLENEEEDKLLIVRKSIESSNRSASLTAATANRDGNKSTNNWNSSRWTKLPFRPPKLRFGSKPVPTKTRRIAYGSMVKTRRLGGKDVTAAELIPLAYTNSSQIGGHDILELSSSEKRTSRMRIGQNHHDRRYQDNYHSLHHSHHHNHHQSANPHQILQADEPALERIRDARVTGKGEMVSSSSSPYRSSTNSDTRSNSRNIPKLLLPKASRPAMYSLNGFIPKPNIQRITTSTTSTTTTARPSFINRLNRKESARSYNNLDKNNRRKHEFKHQQSLDDSDDLKISGSVNRLSKRRGYLSSSKQRSSNTLSGTNDSRYKLAGRPGEPGKDFPTINTIPKTSFDCKDHIGGSGFYADSETGCQVWHMCQGHRKHSFLCPNGTIFNQRSGVCDWWYNVDCEGPITVLGTSETSLRTNTRSGSSSLFDTLLMERRRLFH